MMRREIYLLSCLLVSAGCFDPAGPPPDAEAATDGGSASTGGVSAPLGGESSGEIGGSDEESGSTTDGGAAETGEDEGCVTDEECEDTDPCSIDTCDAGECRHDPNTDDPACSCDAAADCTHLPPDDLCQVRVCDDHVCRVSYMPDGMPVTDTQQTAEDCKLVVCDGAGGKAVINDDTDVPDDGSDCTTDVCSDGVPSNLPLDEGAECAAGYCDGAGSCVGCNAAADCGGEDTFCSAVTCDAGVCGVEDTAAGTPVPEQTADDCREVQCDGNGNEAPVADDDDLPEDDGNDCTDEVCIAGEPAHPPATGDPCNDGMFCTVTDTCNSNGECVGTGDPCSAGDGDSDCSEACDESTNSCTADEADGTACNDDIYCNGADTCSGGSCNVHAGDPCPGPDGDADCTESCNEVNANCTAEDPIGSACDDGLYCNGTDSCFLGSCGGHTGDPCPGPDGDSDCTESCNEATDTCSANDPSGSDCGNCRTCSVGSCLDVCPFGACCPGDVCLPPGELCPLP